jgi:hypothetical protein
VSINLLDVFRIDFRTSSEADALNTSLQKSLKLDYRYQPARLGLSLSLADPSQPPPMADMVGKPIRGETLFGQEEGELALWVALIFEHDNTNDVTRKRLIDLVAAHWSRGLFLLAKQSVATKGAAHKLLLQLARE